MTQLLRSFCTMLGLVSRGEFAEVLDAEMKKLLEAIDQMPNGVGKGSITVTVEFIGELGRTDIKVSHKAKPPETNKFVKTPFWLIDGALSTQHPSQIDLFAGPRGVRRREEDEDAIANA